MPSPGTSRIRAAPADAERHGHGRLVLVAERERSAQVQEPGELQRFRLLERPRVEERDEIHAVVETLERVARAVEDSGRVVEPLVEQVAPAHQPNLPAQADVGREHRPLGRRHPVIRDRILVVGERREVAANAELETVVKVQIDEGVQNVDRPAQSPVDRELVLDPLGDVAVEEDPLAGQENAAIGRDLVALTPDPCVDLGLEVDSKTETPRPRSATESRGRRCPLAASSWWSAKSVSG